MSSLDATLANLASRIQLKKAAILLVEPNTQSMDILAQIFMGFGANQFLKATTFEEAQKASKSAQIELIICEATLQPFQPDGYEFVSWLRRSGLQPNAYAPAILVSSHTSARCVNKARDSGAHFMVMKPLAPTVLLERIVWIAQTNRPFVSCDAYAGPDRRFQNLGPPDGDGRRATDLSADVGLAQEPNMSQNEIDGLLKPAKAAT